MKKYYCGPYYFPRKLTKILSVSVNESCKTHDTHYKFKTHPKLLADLIFLFSMLYESCKNVLKGSLGIIMAPIFFLFALTFGLISWNKK